jgi:Dehydrogenases (flavoproteins)
MTDAGTVSAHPGGPRGLWLGRAAAFGLRDGAEAPCPPVRVFHAATHTLFPGFGPGFLAIGDAEAAYDPLSSWGIAKGVADGNAAARALAAMVSGRDDALPAQLPAHRAVFERFRAARRDAYAAEDLRPDVDLWFSASPPPRAKPF